MDNLERNVKLKRHEVRWIHSTFVYIRSLMQDVVIPAKQYFEGPAFTTEIGYNDSSIRRFKEIHESDMILKPDHKTLVIIPWNSDANQKSAEVIRDIYEAYEGKEPSDVYPRGYVIKRANKEAEDQDQGNLIYEIVELHPNVVHTETYITVFHPPTITPP